ncbi:MAG: ADP-ribosylglycohydrolase family protein [Symploca sp. SIO2C1]|nr:ADP-ribosylglycohydrolase family protein [Symploca sp. SIO2C1]
MPDINAEIESQIYGVIFGQAVGDALGFGTEFLSKSQVAQEYPSGLDTYRQITRFQPSQDKGYMLTWSPGDWTDDTDQILCILDSLLEHHRVDVLDIARRFHHWAITDGGEVKKGVGELF